MDLYAQILFGIVVILALNAIWTHFRIPSFPDPHLINKQIPEHTHKTNRHTHAHNIRFFPQHVYANSMERIVDARGRVYPEKDWVLFIGGIRHAFNATGNTPRSSHVFTFVKDGFWHLRSLAWGSEDQGFHNIVAIPREMVSYVELPELVKKRRGKLSGAYDNNLYGNWGNPDLVD